MLDFMMDCFGALLFFGQAAYFYAVGSPLDGLPTQQAAAPSNPLADESREDLEGRAV